jgi:hypothetical protein
MAILKLVQVIDEQELVLGFVCQYPDGTFWFNPKIGNHKPSKRRWGSAINAIPRWAYNRADRIEETQY